MFEITVIEKPPFTPVNQLPPGETAALPLDVKEIPRYQQTVDVLDMGGLIKAINKAPTTPRVRKAKLPTVTPGRSSSASA